MKGKKRKPTGARATTDVKRENAERNNKKKKPVQTQPQVVTMEQQGEKTQTNPSNTEAGEIKPINRLTVSTPSWSEKEGAW